MAWKEWKNKIHSFRLQLLNIINFCYCSPENLKCNIRFFKTTGTESFIFWWYPQNSGNKWSGTHEEKGWMLSLYQRHFPWASMKNLDFDKWFARHTIDEEKRHFHHLTLLFSANLFLTSTLLQKTVCVSLVMWQGWKFCC